MAILLFLLWIIWNGKLSVEIILFGVLLTVPAFLFGVKVLGYSLESERRFWRNFPLFLLYSLTLIREIFKAALAVALLAFDPKGKPEPANSITLTPGTYTLFQDKDHFVVHCLRREYAEGIDNSSFVELLRKVK